MKINRIWKTIIEAINLVLNFLINKDNERK